MSNSRTAKKVVIGGTVRKVGGRITGFFDRIATWFGLDPDRGRYEIAGGNMPATKQALLDEIITRSGVKGHLVESLRELHHAICDQYVTHISAIVLSRDRLTPEVDILMPGVTDHRDWVQRRYTPEAHRMRFWISGDDRVGKNYSDGMWLLKNMHFQGWTGEIKGFCPDEPVARFKQLLDFPIDRFGPLQMPAIEWPSPPDAVSGVTGDVVKDFHELKEQAHLWEEYYTRLYVQIGELVGQLQYNPTLSESK